MAWKLMFAAEGIPLGIEALLGVGKKKGRGGGWGAGAGGGADAAWVWAGAVGGREGGPSFAPPWAESYPRMRMVKCD